MKKIFKTLFIMFLIVSSGCGEDYSKAPPEPKNIKPKSQWPENWPSQVCSPSEHEIFKGNRNFSENWNSCSRDTWGNEDETRNCIRSRYTGMGTKCASCFAAFTACGKAHCSYWTCLTDNKDCRKCGWQNCGTQLEKCFGFSRKDMYEWY